MPIGGGAGEHQQAVRNRKARKRARRPSIRPQTKTPVRGQRTEPYTPPTPEKFVAPRPKKGVTKGAKRSGTTPSAPGRAPQKRVGGPKKLKRQERNAAQFRRNVTKRNKRIGRDLRRNALRQLRYLGTKQPGPITQLERDVAEVHKAKPTYKRARREVQRQKNQRIYDRGPQGGHATPQNIIRANKNVTSPFEHIAKTGTKIAKGIKKAPLPQTARVITPAGSVGPRLKKSQSPAFVKGGQTLAGAAVADVAELTATAPTSIAMALEMSKTGKGRRKLIKSLKDETAVGNLAQGKIKKAGKIMAKRPVSTGLEVSGVGAAGGRVIGTAGRAARIKAFEHRAGRLHGTKRARDPKRLYAGNKGGPVVEQDWSKNALVMAAQKASQRKRRKQETAGERKTRNEVQKRIDEQHRARDVAAARSAQERVEYLEKGRAEKRGRVAARKAAGRQITPGRRRRAKRREAPAQGAKMVAGATVRSRATMKADLRKRLAEIKRQEPQARERGVLAQARNADQQGQIKALLAMSDKKLDRVFEAGVAYARGEEPVQASARMEGAFPPGSADAKLRATAQTHMDAEAGTRRKTPEYLRQQELEARAATAEATVPRVTASTERARRNEAVAAERARGQERAARGEYPGDFAERHARIVAGEEAPKSTVARWTKDPHLVKKAKRELGIKRPVIVHSDVGGMDSHYMFKGGKHHVYVPSWRDPGEANRMLWWELQRAKDTEAGGTFPRRLKDREAYFNSPDTKRAKARADSAPYSLVRAVQRQDLTQRQGQRLLEAIAIRQEAEGRLGTTKAGAKAARAAAKEAKVPKSQATTKPWMQEKGTKKAIEPADVEQMLKDVGRDPATVTHMTSEMVPRTSAGPTRKSKGTIYGEGAEPIGAEALIAQSRRGTAEKYAAYHHNEIVRRYGIDAELPGLKRDPNTGRRYSESKAVIDQAAMKHNDANPDMPVAGFNIARFNEAGAQLRVLQAQGMPLNEIVDARARLRVDVDIEHGQGKWVLMPQDVKRELMGFEDNDPALGKTFDRFTGHWKDIVLTSASPSSWLFANAADLFIRSLAEGLTPADLVRGALTISRLKKGTPEEQGIAARWTSGGLYHTGEATPRLRGNLTGGPTPWSIYKGGIYRLEHLLEEMPQMARVGKAMRADIKFQASAKGLLKMHTSQIEAFIKGVKTRPGAVEKVAGQIEDVIGRWGKLRPAMRKLRAFAPFVQWLMAATRWVYVTLPGKHPAKTGLYAAVSQATEKDRRELGLSLLAPGGGFEKLDRAQPYQLGMTGQWPWQAPGTRVEEVGGKKVTRPEGLLTGRLFSAGTASLITGPEQFSHFMLPQISGVFGAFEGESWTGQDFVYPDWHPNKDMRGQPFRPEDKGLVALGSLLEATIPGMMAYRRIVQEQGRPSYPTSTVLTPETFRKYDVKSGKFKEEKSSVGTGLREWADPLTRRRAWTHRDIKRFDESRIMGQGIELLKSRADAKKKVETFTGGSTKAKGFQPGTAQGFKPKKKIKRKNPGFQP